MWEHFQISVIDFEFNSVMVRGYTLCDFNPFTFIDTGFMAQNIVYLGEAFMFTWIVCVFCCCQVEYKYQLGQIGWYCCSSLLSPY